MGSLFTAQLAAKAMREKGKGGNIALIASSAAYGPTPSRCMAVYSASKGAIKTAVQSLAIELAPYGIRVNSISPGFMSTEMVFETALKKPELWSTINETPLLKRIGYSGDLKGVVGFLLSDASAYTTGIDILVDGGLNCGRY
jgi:NAD(P)-dependent dehydrogenase (short-subunit alcohol dehydrogenase family)